MAPVAELLAPDGPPRGLEPGGPDRVSEAVRDVIEPPGCVVAIDVSDEFAAFACQ